MAGDPPLGLKRKPDEASGRLSTWVLGYATDVLATLPRMLSAVTWAYATGECGEERFEGVGRGRRPGGWTVVG